MERNDHLLLRDAPDTITARLLGHARAMPDQVAYTFLRDDGQTDTMTYGALARRAAALAGYLAGAAPPGARMLLLYPAGLEFISAYFACLLAGMIAVPAALPHPTRASRRLQALLADAAPALILTRSDCTAAIHASLALIDADAHPCLATDAPAPGGAQADLPAVTPGMTAFLQYTSGSTALPKGVEITHANIASNAEAIRAGFGLGPSSVTVSWLPLFHDMGLIGSVVAPMYVGFHAVLMAPAAFLKQPAMWLEAITFYRATCAGAPNFGWEYCVKKVGVRAKAQIDLSSLKVAYNGAEPVRAATLRAFVDAFAPCGMRATALFPCYGMAETTLFIAGGPADRAPLVRTVSKAMLEGNEIRDAAPGSVDARDVVSSGIVAPMHQVLIVDPESHRPAARHRVGEVWVRGPSVARGYWQQPDATRAAFDNYVASDQAGPFLRTGDLGFMQDGELFITGRLKDLIIVNGRNIYPQDVEEVIERAIDFIGPNRCAAFPVEIDGEERLALVLEANRTLVRAASHTGGDDVLVRIEATAREICTVIGRQFDVAVAALVFVRPGSFPRTTSGKVERARCKELAVDGALDVVYVMPGSLFDRRAAPPLPLPLPTAQAAPAAVAPVDAGVLHSRTRADAMIAWFRQYAARRLQARVGDERRTIAPYVVLDLGNQGFFGLQVPVTLGGAGLRAADLLRVMEQLAAVDLTIATMVGVHNGLGVRPILQAGTAEVRQRLLPPLAAGRQLAAFALTEPAAGANPAAMRATAKQTPGGWIVNAEKQWIGLAAWAGVITVFAKAFDAAGGPLGTLALVVPEDTPGLSQGPEALTMGMRGMIQNTVFLHDAFLPDAAVLRAPGEGMDVARDAMLFARLGIAAMCIGGMKRCAQLMARYAERREVATGRLLEHPVTIARLQELGAAIFATEALVQAIAGQLDAGHTVASAAYLACKTTSTELFGQAADALVQLLGGRGYIETNGAPQILRDARVLRILEGPTETLYSHLGATLNQAGGNVFAFLDDVLRQSALAAQLDASVQAIRTAASAGRQPFASAAALHQWLDYRLGELAAAAILLGAAQYRAPGTQAVHAVAWARRRFVALEQAILADLAGATPYAASATLLHMVRQYSAAIGDVDQAESGAGQHIDPMLRSAAQASVPASAAQPVPCSATVPAHAPTPMETTVHDAVLAWLRDEKRRAEVALDVDTPFTSLGIDSLATVAIAADLEQRTGLVVAPELLYDCQSVRTLAACLDQRVAAPQAA